MYHEFFRVESWTEYQLALKEESEPARLLKQRAFAANDWETLPAEIHYPVLHDYRAPGIAAEAPREASVVEEPLLSIDAGEAVESSSDDHPESEFLEDLADADVGQKDETSSEKHPET